MRVYVCDVCVKATTTPTLGRDGRTYCSRLCEKQALGTPLRSAPAEKADEQTDRA